MTRDQVLLSHDTWSGLPLTWHVIRSSSHMTRDQIFLSHAWHMIRSSSHMHGTWSGFPLLVCTGTAGTFLSATTRLQLVWILRWRSIESSECPSTCKCTWHISSSVDSCISFTFKYAMFALYTKCSKILKTCIVHVIASPVSFTSLHMQWLCLLLWAGLSQSPVPCSTFALGFHTM